jgi:hypothetical protein
MTTLILSFIALVSIATFIVLSTVGIGRLFFNRCFPEIRDLLFHLGLNIGITLIISREIRVVFSCSGSVEAQFFDLQRMSSMILRICKSYFSNAKSLALMEQNCMSILYLR